MEKIMKYQLNQSAYVEASKAVCDFINKKLGQPKYKLKRHDPTVRDYSMTPTVSGVIDCWSLSDRFGDFFEAPNGETRATYVSNFGLAANTYEDDIFEIVDNVLSDAFLDKYDMSIDDYHDNGRAQDFVCEELRTFIQSLESEENTSIGDFLDGEKDWWESFPEKIQGQS